MAESAAVSNPAAEARATWRDYKELTKPGVVALMILTSVIGMCMAVPGWVPLDALILGNLGIALCAGAAAAVNHVVDQRIDQRMARTRNRPLAKGRVSNSNAILFATALGVAGMAILLIWVNALTAWLTLASLVGYAFVYTAIAGSAIVQGEVSGHLEVGVNGVPGSAMQAFGGILNDVDLAAVITYQRNAFGNNMGDMVQPIDIFNFKKG